MKKKVNAIHYIFIILIISIITSCSLNKEVEDLVFNSETVQNEDVSNQNPTDEQDEDFSNDISIYDIKNEDLYKYLNINNNIVSLAYNTNKDSTINRTINIYGKILTSDDTKTIESILTGKFEKIILYSGESIVAETLTYNIRAFKAESGCDFELELKIDDLLVEQQNIIITSIEFVITNELSFKMKTDNYYLTKYNELENSVKIIDCPLSLVNPVKPDTTFRVTYTFLTANNNYNENFDLSIEIPMKLNEFIEVKSIEYYEDDKMKLEVEEVLNSQMTLNQKRNLKVITVAVDYQKLSDSQIIIQPLIKLDIIGEYQQIGPYEPLIL